MRKLQQYLDLLRGLTPLGWTLVAALVAIVAIAALTVYALVHAW